MRLRLRYYIKYKFLNSFFTGLSVGSVFVIYSPLKPSIFSLGGILLAVGMLVVAKFYDILLNIKRYFQISLFVEVVILCLILLFLIDPYTYKSALLIYLGYQLTFMFGSYLVRAETLIVKKAVVLTKVDIAKQIGYLFGMVFSYLFYLSLDGFDKNTQVYYLHYLFLAVEILIIYLLLKSFAKK